MLTPTTKKGRNANINSYSKDRSFSNDSGSNKHHNHSPNYSHNHNHSHIPIPITIFSKTFNNSNTNKTINTNDSNSTNKVNKMELKLRKINSIISQSNRSEASDTNNYYLTTEISKVPEVREEIQEQNSEVFEDADIKRVGKGIFKGLDVGEINKDNDRTKDDVVNNFTNSVNNKITATNHITPLSHINPLISSEMSNCFIKKKKQKTYTLSNDYMLNSLYSNRFCNTSSNFNKQDYNIDDHNVHYELNDLNDINDSKPIDFLPKMNTTSHFSPIGKTKILRRDYLQDSGMKEIKINDILEVENANSYSNDYKQFLRKNLNSSKDEEKAIIKNKIKELNKVSDNMYKSINNLNGLNINTDMFNKTNDNYFSYYNSKRAAIKEKLSKISTLSKEKDNTNEVNVINPDESKKSNINKTNNTKNINNSNNQTKIKRLSILSIPKGFK